VNVIERFIVIRVVNIVQLLYDIYIYIMNIFLREYDLFIISVVISELVQLQLQSVKTFSFSRLWS